MEEEQVYCVRNFVVEKRPNRADGRWGLAVLELVLGRVMSAAVILFPLVLVGLQIGR